MTSLAISSPTAATLPSPNIHPHGHGHKRGSEVDSLTDPSSSSTAAAQSPTASSQNPFGSLLTTLEQVIGIQPTNQASATPSAQSSQGAQSAQAGQPTLVQAAQQSIGSKLNMIV